MDHFILVGRVLRAFMAVVFLLLLSKECFSEVPEIMKDFGDSATLKCGQSLVPDTITWLKDGNKINETRKTRLKADNLYIYCLESSDSGIYQCMINNIIVKSHKLTVINPENRTYFHIYNQDHARCVSVSGLLIIHLALSSCYSNDCQQKWSWSANGQLMSANYNTQCISVDGAFASAKIGLDSCTSKTTLQKWECKDDDLLSIQGNNLYFNYGNSGSDFKLFRLTGVWSRWVKYSTRNNLCVKKPKERTVTVSPAQLVLSTSSMGKLRCHAKNFIKPSYTWLKNGKPFQESSPSVHISSEDLVIPFAYDVAAGNYTCVAKDDWATAEATAIIEVFEDPSVIQHFLDQTIDLENDCCLSCQMYITANLYEVNWYKDGILVSPSNTKFNITNKGKGEFNKLRTYLCMKSVQYDDSGEYACEIKYLNHSSSVKGKLQVFDKPRAYINELGDHLLMCNATGLPPPRLVWYKDDKNILDNENNEKSLTIKETGGNYTCVASNSRGTHSVSYISNVPDKPRAYINELGDHLLMCNATGLPPPRLVWYKDDKNILDNENNEKSLTIKETGGNYTCVASNSRGTHSVSYISNVPVASRKSEKASLVIIICSVVGGILLALVVIILICCYCRRKKIALHNNNDDAYQIVRYTSPPGEYATPIEQPARTRIEFQPHSNTDPGPKHFSLKAKMYNSMKPRSKMEWEIPPDCIKLEMKLGEGQFGQVWKAQVLTRKGSRTVAIKMLPEKFSTKDRKALIDELEFMKTMTPHPNIVGLVGCSTRSERVMVIVEYVRNGDLKQYLLRSRGQSEDTYSNMAPYSKSLSSNDLMSFAYQIARGMSYLEKIKCVHRDLAARNILVDDDKTCKIADFGLARDIYNENYYRKTNGGRLPLRWMAYESIFNGITTNQSDAWSFGVLLWEIVTLGGNPYPDLNRDQLIDALQRGYRMPKPHHCSDEVYAIMWECWQQNPDKRPTFAELTASFLRLISLQQIAINMEKFGDDDYVNVGSYEMNDDN